MKGVVICSESEALVRDACGAKLLKDAQSRDAKRSACTRLRACEHAHMCVRAWLHVCMAACVRVRAHMCERVLVAVYAWVRACVRACSHICTRIASGGCGHNVCSHICVHVHACVHACVHVHRYATALKWWKKLGKVILYQQYVQQTYADTQEPA